MTIHITTSGLSLTFNENGNPISLKTSAGKELLDLRHKSFGFINRTNNRTIQFFTKITVLGNNEYRFETLQNPLLQLTAKFGGKNGYITIRYTSLPKQDSICFHIRASVVKALPLDYMITGVGGPIGTVEVQRTELWEQSKSNPLGGFALYEPVNNDLEDDILLNLWVDEGLAHPQVEKWDKKAAVAWLDKFETIVSDISSILIQPHSLEEHYEFVEYAKKMEAKAINVRPMEWRGEYVLCHKQIDSINPNLYPNGLQDWIDFRENALKPNGLNLNFWTLAGGIGRMDQQYITPKVHPDVHSWGAMVLHTPITENAQDFVVTPQPGVQIPIRSKNKWPNPPTMIQACTADFFNINGEWMHCQNVMELGDGTWKLCGVKRGQLNTPRKPHDSGEVIKGYYSAYNMFLADPNTELFSTIAKKYATLSNTLALADTSFDGYLIPGATGRWADLKYAQCVYKELDHPTKAGSSIGGPPRAWHEYQFNRIKRFTGRRFYTPPGADLYLANKSRIASGMEEIDHMMFRVMISGNRSFGFCGIHLTLTVLRMHGLTEEAFSSIKHYKHACFAMTPQQIESMNSFHHGKKLNGMNMWASTLWRPEGSLMREWYALSPNAYSHEWCYGQEFGVTTPRFYLQTENSETLEMSKEVKAKGADHVRIIGRLLPRFDPNSIDNWDLMKYVPSNKFERDNPCNTAVWDRNEMAHYRIMPPLNLSTKRGLGLWVSGDGSGATLVITLKSGSVRDYVVPITFQGKRWIEIPTCEQGWKVKNWGWTQPAGAGFDFTKVREISIGLGHVPASTKSSIVVEGLKALSEINTPLSNPTFTLGDSSVKVSCTIHTENHFILDPDGKFTVYDEAWRVVHCERASGTLLLSPGCVKAPLFTVTADPSSPLPSVWLEAGVQVSNHTIENPDTNAPAIWTGGSNHGAWTDPSNWQQSAVPKPTQEVIVRSFANVTEGQNEFKNLKVDFGSTVFFSADKLEGTGKELNIQGTLDNVALLELTNSTLSLSGTLGVSEFVAKCNSTINFYDGASFSRPNMGIAFRGPSDCKFTCKFILSKSGFGTISAGRLRQGASWKQFTFIIDVYNDVGEYSKSNIRLLTFENHHHPIYDGPFNPTVRIYKKGQNNFAANLSFDTVSSTIVLQIVTADSNSPSPSVWLNHAIENPDTNDPAIWTGGSEPGAWTDASNWQQPAVPKPTQEVIVRSFAKVTEGQNDFKILKIGHGSKVLFSAGKLEGVGRALYIQGTLDNVAILRLTASTLSLSGTLGASDIILIGSTINFYDGASFSNASTPNMGIAFRGPRDCKFTCKFTLSKSGFRIISAGRLGAGANWKQFTFLIDVSSYDVGQYSKSSIRLLTFRNRHHQMYNEPFNPTVRIHKNDHSSFAGNLTFDTASSTIVLKIS